MTIKTTPERARQIDEACARLNARWAQSRAEFDAWVAAGGSIYGGKPAPHMGGMWPGGREVDPRCIS